MAKHLKHMGVDELIAQGDKRKAALELCNKEIALLKLQLTIARRKRFNAQARLDTCVKWMKYFGNNS